MRSMPLALVLTIASAVAPAVAAAAPQETVNQASLSGRVTDPQGAAVDGALVSTPPPATRTIAASPWRSSVVPEDGATRTNVLARNANFGTGTYPANPAPTFGQITAVGDARSLQLAAKLRF